jgi:hypothetical protein
MAKGKKEPAAPAEVVGNVNASSAESNPGATQILEQEYELVPVDKLKAHPENARKGDLASIGKSIAANGFYGAVVAQKSTGYILAGRHRWEAGKAEGLAKIPVVWVDVDAAGARRILLADNKTSDDASYDDLGLAKLLLEIQSEIGTLEGTGYEPPDLAELFQQLGDQVMEGFEGAEKERKASGIGSDLVYRVIVDCESELQQSELLERFEAEGLNCKPLIS